MKLDTATRGRIAPGSIVEWGIPHGNWGRLITLNFLKQPWLPCAWIHGQCEGEVYPPGFAAQGVSLEQIFFIPSDQPIKELRPIFLESTFKFIVIDSPKILKTGDLAFLAAQVREYQQIVFIIRPYYLSPRRGNPFCLLRINCSYLWHTKKFRLQFIRGGNLQPIYISQQEAFNGNF